ncbi:MAG: hemolysin III family protein, partial [Deinococcota bacterium]
VNSLSIRNPRWLDALHLNFSHHVEHHVLPGVNPVHAPKIRAVLKHLYPERYHEMPWGMALATLWRTPRFYGPDRVTFVDPEGRVYGTLGHGLKRAPSPQPSAPGETPQSPRPSVPRRLYAALREPISGLTHWFGAALSLAFLVVLLVWANANDLSRWPFLVFGVSAVLLYIASASYHSFQVSERALRWLRKLDHSAIFLLIAGSYTPLAYFGLSGGARMAVLVTVWGVALAGILLKLVTLRLPRWVSTGLYLAMGWVGVLYLPHLVKIVPSAALVWLGVGGLLYTLGAVVYATRKLDFKPGVFGFHEVWHLFVLGGTSATFAMALNLR